MHEASKHIHVPELVPSSSDITRLKHAGLFFFFLNFPFPNPAACWRALRPTHGTSVFARLAQAPRTCPSSPPKSQFNQHLTQSSAPRPISRSVQPLALPPKGLTPPPKPFPREPPSCYPYGLTGRGNWGLAREGRRALRGSWLRVQEHPTRYAVHVRVVTSGTRHCHPALGCPAGLRHLLPIPAKPGRGAQPKGHKSGHPSPSSRALMRAAASKSKFKTSTSAGR